MVCWGILRTAHTHNIAFWKHTQIWKQSRETTQIMQVNNVGAPLIMTPNQTRPVVEVWTHWHNTKHCQSERRKGKITDNCWDLIATEGGWNIQIFYVSHGWKINSFINFKSRSRWPNQYLLGCNYIVRINLTILDISAVSFMSHCSF